MALSNEKIEEAKMAFELLFPGRGNVLDLKNGRATVTMDTKTALKHLEDGGRSLNTAKHELTILKAQQPVQNRPQEVGLSHDKRHFLENVRQKLTADKLNTAGHGTFWFNLNSAVKLVTRGANVLNIKVILNGLRRSRTHSYGEEQPIQNNL